MTATLTTLDLRAQVTEVLFEKVAVAQLGDCVFPKSIPFLLQSQQLPSWLRPGSWVHAEGAAYFCTPGAAIGIQPPDGTDPARTLRWASSPHVALAQGRDGVRAVLHYHTSHLDPHETPPAITVGSLLRITCPFDWYPGALGKPIPVNVPILDLWYAADFATVQEREA